MNHISRFVDRMMWSEWAQDTYTDVICQDRVFNSTAPKRIDEWLWVPKDVVWQFVDQSYVAQVKEKNRDRIINHTATLLTDGWLKPVELIYSKDGLVTIKDGNHRMIAAMDIISMDYIPVSITETPRVNGGKRMGHMVEALFESYGKTSREHLKARDYLIRQ